LQQRGGDDGANTANPDERDGAFDALDGQAPHAVQRTVRDAQQIPGERRILRNDPRHLRERGVIVVDRGQQLGQERRPARNVFRPGFDFLQDLLYGQEYRRVLRVGRQAQRFTR
jgi:hypothetical protein